MSLQSVETRTAYIHILENGIVKSITRSGAEQTLQDAIENMEATFKLVPDRKLLLLVDLSGLKSQTAEARTYYSSDEEINKKVIAVAICSNTRIGNLISNFYLKINKPIIPFRLFSNETKAIDWLLKQAC
ncbi:MAG: hypothetical protein H7A25_10370 [Leptospiraceae bacterium]|nr:hypothetical protein [Leptospiraceae bacterium]